MEEAMIKEQIQLLDRKIDRLLEFVEEQHRKREEIDDLVTDVSLVAKDAFKNSVVLLDKAQVELDYDGFVSLIIRVLQNVDTFHELIEMLESAKDFAKDVTPILHQVGLDAVNKMNELDQKGYFEYIRLLTRLLTKWVEVFPAEDLQKVENNLDNIARIVRNLSDPEFLATLNKITKVISNVKMEDEKEVLSMWRIVRQLNSKEVRKSISYSLKVMKEIAR
ncbi:MAG: hypothetical protein ABSD71_00410 [Bacteroidales bacterium]